MDAPQSPQNDRGDVRLDQSVRQSHEDISPHVEVASTEIALDHPDTGDFHAAFAIPGETERVGVVIGDVTGHGAEAAEKANVLLRLARHELNAGSGPQGTIEAINDVANTFDDQYATAFVGVLETASGTFKYANAGHEPSLISHPTSNNVQVDELHASGPPLGVLSSSDAEYEEHKTHLRPGDSVLSYTDGLTEARRYSNPRKYTWFGIDRLKSIMSGYSKTSVKTLVSVVVQKVLDFCRNNLRDDFAVLAVRLKPAKRTAKIGAAKAKK